MGLIIMAIVLFVLACFIFGIVDLMWGITAKRGDKDEKTYK